MKKIKWLNVIKLFLFIFALGVIVHDLYFLTIHNFITGKLYGWTWLGFFTFILATITAGAIYQDFEEQIKKMSTTSDSQHLK